MKSPNLAIWLEFGFAILCIVCGGLALLMDLDPQQTKQSRGLNLREKKLVYRVIGVILVVVGLILLYLELPFVL